MNNARDISVLILAGGQSSRMGENKAFMEFRGKSFVKNIIDAVLPISNKIWISGNHDNLDSFGFPVIRDEIPGKGPVSALSSSFKKINSNEILVLSCDIPQIKTEDISFLLDQIGDEDLTMYTYMNRKMPLVGVYQKTSFSPVYNALKYNNLRLFDVINALSVNEVEFGGDQGLLNINTKKDLEKII
jgi:molybdopterin-guanine dinucleotide biosynthesis protein A